MFLSLDIIIIMAQILISTISNELTHWGVVYEALPLTSRTQSTSFSQRKLVFRNHNGLSKIKINKKIISKTQAVSSRLQVQKT